MSEDEEEPEDEAGYGPGEFEEEAIRPSRRLGLNPISEGLTSSCLSFKSHLPSTQVAERALLLQGFQEVK